MNINEHAEELKKEEQRILDELIGRMDKVIEKLDYQMQEYVEEARNIDISLNPDAYLSRLLAKQGLNDTKENRKKVLQARDELYGRRILVHYKNIAEEGMEEIKLGLHSYGYKGKRFVMSWYMPLGRQFVFNDATEFV